uniref:DNA replication ATP-dependent helicase/nuclease n=1 Tax=Strigamia maritima TaxID=126957 RepID=T1IXE8_STRMM
MKSSLKSKKPATTSAQPKISSYFQKTSLTTTSKRYSFTTADTTKNYKLTQLRNYSPENSSSLELSPNEIGPTPTQESIAKKVFNRESSVLSENNIKRRELKCRLFEDEKNSKTKSVKRHSGDSFSPNSKQPLKLSKQEEGIIPEEVIIIDEKEMMIEETQTSKSKFIHLQSLTVIEETQLGSSGRVVDETQFGNIDKLNFINLQSLNVIKETQLEQSKSVGETQFPGSDGLTSTDPESLTVIKETQLNVDNKVLQVVEETQIEESSKIELGSVKVIEETQLNDKLNKEKMNDLLSDDEFLQFFDNMSPFKLQNEIPCKPKIRIAPFLTGLGRHVVINIEKSSNEIVLSVRSEEDECVKTCKLKDFWVQTNVKLNDIVNILSTFDSNQVATIDNTNGLIIVNPDHLLSGTSVVSSLFCMRKSVLMEQFRGSDPANFIMVIGSLIHQIFQEALCKQAFTAQAIGVISKNILMHNSNLHAIYSAGSNETEVMEEIQKFIPQILLWFQQYVPNTKKSGDFIKVTDIYDIEENIWSPRYGVKGKIDVIPIELKTGRSSFSPEHEGQVILYSMMCSDRRSDPEGGLLVYLRDGKTKEVKAEHNQKRGLIQLRNELIHYIDQPVNENEIGVVHSLPETLNSNRLCSRCPYATVCCVYSSLDDRNILPSDHEMRVLIPEFAGHLSEAHKKYFMKWQHLLRLESSLSRKFSFINGIYCQTSDERQKKGLAFSQMKVERKDSISETSNGLFMMKFSKTSDAQSSLDNTDVEIGEMVIVSCEATKEFAIASGTVRDVKKTYVQVEIDKNLSLRPDFSSAVFRLDRYTSGNVTAIAAGSLIKLIDNNDMSAKLRRLIIDGERPQFIERLTDSVLIGKKILKKLNSSQTRAVIKSLTAQDYFLIKGMPGTGKTSTIVALVRLLDLLGYSVLLTSHTHSAVDNILIKLKNYGIDFLRLGKCSKIHPDIHPFAAEKLVQKLTTVKDLKEFYESKNIYATTCLGSNYTCLQRKRFDFCIIDEAAQVVQIACLGPLFYSNRFILIGDPLQLPPLVQNRMARKNGMDQSLFELLDSADSTIDLNIQYRMNKTIMSLANELVYNGRLKCGSDEIARSTIKLNNLTSKSKLFSTLLEDSVVFIDTDRIPAPELSDNLGIKNAVEAEIILQIVKLLKKDAFNMDEIGIISIYSAQVKNIRELLLQNNISTVEVNTVDQFQGRDKEVILVSFVRSTPNMNKLGEILFDFRRLNVAITRAKHKAILIGSISTLTNYPPVNKLIQIVKENTIHFEHSFHQDILY